MLSTSFGALRLWSGCHFPLPDSTNRRLHTPTKLEFAANSWSGATPHTKLEELPHLGHGLVAFVVSRQGQVVHPGAQCAAEELGRARVDGKHWGAARQLLLKVGGPCATLDVHIVPAQASRVS